jgi:hypothetical protein
LIAVHLLISFISLSLIIFFLLNSLMEGALSLLGGMVADGIAVHGKHLVDRGVVQWEAVGYLLKQLAAWERTRVEEEEGFSGKKKPKEKGIIGLLSFRITTLTFNQKSPRARPCCWRA